METIQLTEKLISDNINLVRKIAHKFTNIFMCYGVEFDDCVQQGILGLNEAIKRFDHKKYPDTKFSTYAFRWIRKYIQIYVNDQRRIKLISDSRNDFVLSLDHNAEDDSNSTGYNFLEIANKFDRMPDENLTKSDEFQFVKLIMNKILSGLEIHILQTRYLCEEKQTLEIISQTINCSIQKTRNVEQTALSKLKKFLEKRI
jgi:RNA polymerase sigma factor (sigma-70 family)